MNKRYVFGLIVPAIGCLVTSAAAIEVQPSAEQVRQALERGRGAATARVPPVELYAWFGPPGDPANEFRPRGVKIDRLGRAPCRQGTLSARKRCPGERRGIGGDLAHFGEIAVAMQDEVAARCKREPRALRDRARQGSHR